MNHSTPITLIARDATNDGIININLTNADGLSRRYSQDLNNISYINDTGDALVKHLNPQVSNWVIENDGRLRVDYNVEDETDTLSIWLSTDHMLKDSVSIH